MTGNHDENAKNPKWQAPLDLSGVKPEQYRSDIQSSNGSAASTDKEDGTIGFNPQLAGHGKSGHNRTSEFKAGPPEYTLPGKIRNDTANPK